jgi:hypothetical protein
MSGTTAGRDELLGAAYSRYLNVHTGTRRYSPLGTRGQRTLGAGSLPRRDVETPWGTPDFAPRRSLN